MEEGDIIREIPEDAQRVGIVTSGPLEEIELIGYEEGESKDFSGLKFVWYEKTSDND